MSSTSIEAGGRSADLGVYEWRHQQEAAASPRPAVATREKRRPGRGRLAQALILSLALVTLAGVGSLVAVAILASGSARPTDWGHLNWALVAQRYQVCRQENQSRGPFGCVAAIGPRSGQSATPQQRGLVYVTAPVPAPVQAAAPAAPPPARSSVAPGAGAPAQSPAGSAATPAPAPPAPVSDDRGGGDGGGGGDD